jgi:hypothetical protein
MSVILAKNTKVRLDISPVLSVSLSVVQHFSGQIIKDLRIPFSLNNSGNTDNALVCFVNHNMLLFISATRVFL